MKNKHMIINHFRLCSFFVCIECVWQTRARATNNGICNTRHVIQMFFIILLSNGVFSFIPLSMQSILPFVLILEIFFLESVRNNLFHVCHFHAASTMWCWWFLFFYITLGTSRSLALALAHVHIQNIYCWTDVSRA